MLVRAPSSQRHPQLHLTLRLIPGPAVISTHTPGPFHLSLTHVNCSNIDLISRSARRKLPS